MKKFLGIAAVALIVGAPALAQNASTMAYTLQLGGTPSATGAARYDTSTAVEVGPYTIPAHGDVLNWSARVNVGGTIDGLMPGGAANIVVDLALKDSNGNLVGPNFGIGSPTTAGFFSNVMNQAGGGDFAQQPAAFPWVYDTWYDLNGSDSDENPTPTGNPPGIFHYGRLFDPVSANGPNMAQFTYPSTYMYYRPAGAAAANTTTVTAASGTLMGMGAGYTDFVVQGNAERGGVGLTADNGQLCYGCMEGFWCMEIGNQPIVEGQINMKGLPGGTYTLQLTAGTGNNVLLPTLGCNPYTGGTGGAFAAAANTVTGSTITFVYDPTVAVAPKMTAAASARTHGAAGTFVTPLNITGAGNATSEGRVDTTAGSNPMVVITYDKALSATLPTVVATAVGGAAPTVGTPVVVGSQLQIPLTGATDKTCVTLTITGVADSTGTGIAPAHIVKLTYRKGDVDNSRSVNAADITAVKAHSSLANVNATNYWYDLDCSGRTNSGDITLVKSLSVLGTTACSDVP